VLLAKEASVLRFTFGVITTLIVLAIAGLVVVLYGGYDVAATSPHTRPVAWALNTTMERSVARQAASIQAPASFTDEQARRGYRTYSESCVYCHGAPGQDPTDWSMGMLPEPPYMPDAAAFWSGAQVFWIVKHGIKMSGMPSFGKALNDDAIWDVVAFVSRMPGMSPEVYKGYGQPPAGGAATQ
jgi:mono/diheme cytochrome c family protein